MPNYSGSAFALGTSMIQSTNQELPRLTRIECKQIAQDSKDWWRYKREIYLHNTGSTTREDQLIVQEN